MTAAALMLAAAAAAAARPVADLQLRSPDISSGGMIPLRAVYYGQGGAACRGGNQPPALSWAAAPGGTRSLVIIVYDSDADFYHWAMLGLPPGLRQIPVSGLGARGRELVNDFGHARYDGPCPPPGPAHHYHVRVLALDDSPELAAPVSARAAAAAIAPHVLAEGEITALYASPQD